MAYLAGTAEIKDRSGPSMMVPEDVSDRYHKIAADFDHEVDLQEKVTLLGWRRKRLVRKAYGNVLEVSAGTGRNSRFYDMKRCETITFLDQSGEMLDIGKGKLLGAHPEYSRRCRFLTQSAHEPVLAPPGGYDTVVQTMGVCSTASPAQLLRKLAAITKPDGQILLLEHGRSHYDWLNRILDNAASQHADKFGCWWNKDIGKVIEESGLEVVKMKRFNFGTTWWIELKARDKLAGSE